VVSGGCPHSTGWWGHPDHRQLPREVPGTRDPTTARYIRCLCGAVGLGPGWRWTGRQSPQRPNRAMNCNGGRGWDCRGGQGLRGCTANNGHFQPLKTFLLEGPSVTLDGRTTLGQ
jgi:hypothetical protein